MVGTRVSSQNVCGTVGRAILHETRARTGLRREDDAHLKIRTAEHDADAPSSETEGKYGILQ